MPAEAEAQRRYMMGWAHNPEKMKGKRPKMSKEEMGKFSKMKSYGSMIRNVAWGDIGVKRQAESVKVGGFKAGKPVHC